MSARRSTCAVVAVGLLAVALGAACGSDGAADRASGDDAAVHLETEPDVGAPTDAAAKAAPPSPATTTTTGAVDTTATTTATGVADPTRSTSATSEPEPTTESDVDEPDPADRAWAAQAQLRAADLPGWSATASGALDDPTGAGRLPSGCRYLDGLWEQGPPTASVASPRFASSDGFEILNEITVFPTAAVADAVLRTLDRDTTPACFERILGADEQTIVIDDVHVTRRRVTAGDGGVEYRAGFVVVLDDRPYGFVARFTYARVDRAITFQMAFGFDGVPDETEPAFDAVVRRLVATRP